jgi:hypothetical protein
MNTIVHLDVVVAPLLLDAVVLHHEEEVAAAVDAVRIDDRLFLTDHQLRAPSRAALLLFVMLFPIPPLSAMRQPKPLMLLAILLPRFPPVFIVKSRD